jgi:hypothetical protein
MGDVWQKVVKIDKNTEGGNKNQTLIKKPF